MAAYTISAHIRNINKHRAAWSAFFAGEHSLVALNARLRWLGRNPVTVRGCVNAIAHRVALDRMSELRGLELLTSLGLSGELYLSGLKLEGLYSAMLSKYRKSKTKKARGAPAPSPSSPLIPDETPMLAHWLVEHCSPQSVLSQHSDVKFKMSFRKGMRAFCQSEINRTSHGL